MTPRILIVDDEPFNFFTLEAFLAKEGYDLRFASNGEQACAKARELQPDLILLDVMMPVMDGFEVCRRIRADSVVARIPIILLTALNDDASRVEGLSAGADDFVSKPCSQVELRARVRTIVSLNRYRAIAEQRARFQQLHELAPAGIVLTDAEGVVREANSRAAAEFAEPSGRALTGDVLYARLDTEAAAVVRRAVDAALCGERPLVCEVRHGAADARRILHLRAAAVPDEDGRLALLMFDDVTAEVNAREALVRLNANLEEIVNDRTRELEDVNALLMSYASFVSHDLRTPLTVMKGYLSMIHEGVVAINPDAQPLIAEAYKATLLMQELLENILELAREEHAGRTGRIHAPTDPTPIVNRVALHVRGLYPKLQPRFAIAALPAVGVSPLVVERVFYNLLANALKYSSGMAVPEIAVGATSSEPPVLFVRDHGIGFDERDADHLFEEFSKPVTAARRNGFGLGLSLVARLVRAQGGRIWAESAAGAGATFFVEFPAPAVEARTGS